MSKQVLRPVDEVDQYLLQKAAETGGPLSEMLKESEPPKFKRRKSE